MCKTHLYGRGAQSNIQNIYQKQDYQKEHVEAIDDWERESPKTHVTIVHPKTLVNKVTSPDVGMEYSANPYQGCEHGCIYCYARNSHQYWGYSAGLDFESKIMVKANSAKLFKSFITKKGWHGRPISLSGNTDCYQPLERRFELTRNILKIALEYGQPIGILTKNNLILRDLDLLKELASKGLCRVFLSINSLSKETRSKLEPRTATAGHRLKTLETLSNQGIPVGIMCAPIIPGLTDHEIPAVLQAAKQAGAKWAGYTIVRLNGEIGPLFQDWLATAYPDRAAKIWHSIESCHQGRVNDSEFGNRIRGTGQLAGIITDQFKLHCNRNGLNIESFEYDLSHFNQKRSPQLDLFGDSC
ncbi:MAG: PA0069 family radical SAM protein [Sphingobacterium sp.]